MELLSLDNQANLVFNPIILAFPPFYEFYRKDRSANHHEMLKILLYVYLTTDYKSNFIMLDEESRHKEALAASDVKPEFAKSKEVKQLQEFYAKTQENDGIRLYKSARKAVDKLATFMETVDLTELDDNGKLINKPETLIGAIQKMGGMIESLNLLKNQIEKEQSSSKIRGGGQAGLFEDGI